jgi:outer membrane protein TolC
MATVPAPDDRALSGPVDLAMLEAAVLARHPSLVAGAHRVRALSARARSEDALPAPTLMAELWQVPIARPYAVGDAGMAMLSLEQDIPAPGVLGQRAEATALEARAEAARIALQARALVREVDRTFADYAEAIVRHQAHVEHGRLLDELATASRARYSTGGALADLTKADLERARLEVELTHESGSLEESRARLNGLLVRPALAPLGAPRVGDPETADLTLERATSLAILHNPAIEAVDLDREAASAFAKAASREAVIPAFKVGVSIFAPTNGMPLGYGATAGMSLPWLWGRAAASRDSAKERVQAEVATAESVRLDLRSRAATSFAALRAAERRLLVLRDVARPAARRAIDAARAGYATGATDVLSWLDAVRSAFDIELDLATARADLARALADLEGAIGDRVPRRLLSASPEVPHVH